MKMMRKGIWFARWIASRSKLVFARENQELDEWQKERTILLPLCLILFLTRAFLSVHSLSYFIYINEYFQRFPITRDLHFLSFLQPHISWDWWRSFALAWHSRPLRGQYSVLSVHHESRTKLRWIKNRRNVIDFSDRSFPFDNLFDVSGQLAVNSSAVSHLLMKGKKKTVILMWSLFLSRTFLKWFRDAAKVASAGTFLTTRGEHDTPSYQLFQMIAYRVAGSFPIATAQWL